MKKLELNKMFTKFGREIRLKNNSGWVSPVFHGFIQPLRYKNKIYLDGVYTVIGFDNQGKYLYIGPTNHDLTQLNYLEDIIEADGTKYIIDRAEKVYYSNEPAYIWAIIREVVEVE